MIYQTYQSARRVRKRKTSEWMMSVKSSESHPPEKVVRAGKRHQELFKKYETHATLLRCTSGK
jgi:hypothetical protein